MTSWRTLTGLSWATLLMSACYPLGAVSGSAPTPGSSQPLSEQRVAVDPVTDTIYVLRDLDGGAPSPWVPMQSSCGADASADSGSPTTSAYSQFRQLVSIDPETHAERVVTAFDRYLSGEVTFPPSGVLLHLPGSEIRLFDRSTGAVIARRDLASETAWLASSTSALSTTGRWLAIEGRVDSQSTTATIVDTTTLEILSGANCASYGSGFTTLMGWMHGGDRLVSATYDTSITPASDQVTVDVETVGPGGLRMDASYPVTIPAVTSHAHQDPSQIFAPPPWLVISPNDRYAAIPAAGLLVVDLSTGASSHFADVVWPAAFTPDSSTVVLEVQPNDPGPAHLDFVDLATGNATTVNVPVPDAFAYYVTSEGNEVLISGVDDPNAYGSASHFVIVDRGTHAVTTPTTGTQQTYLRDFVTREGHHEVWILDDVFVDRVDVETGTLTYFSLGFRPSGMGLLSHHDQLAFVDASQSSVTLWDLNRHVSTDTISYRLSE